MFIERDPGPSGSAGRSLTDWGTIRANIDFTMHSHLPEWFARTVHVVGAPVAHPGSCWPGVLNGGGDR
jgi:hypothetical protein